VYQGKGKGGRRRGGGRKKSKNTPLSIPAYAPDLLGTVNWLASNYYYSDSKTLLFIVYLYTACNICGI